MAVTWVYHVPGRTIDQVSDALTCARITPDGLSEQDGVTSAWFTDQPADGLLEGAVAGVGSWQAVDQADWIEEYKRGIRPVTVGRVTITPPWLAPGGPVIDAPDGTIVLVIEPGMAFGTGHHETTMACLAILQELPLAGCHVIDIGTGTGVLALAARALGAASVSAVDNDPEAVGVARTNLAAHPLDGITVALGSCDQAGGPADVVVANIITDKLMALAPDLVRLLRPEGTLVASGIAVERMDEAAAAFTAAGIALSHRPGTEWAVLIGHR
ncbi:MAG TPA: 50S ribosomal protein L11 methyltransferase [Euzebya sp.]|nr:50S ribosomal protein L11 methyltransferase [Euzebya sp.]